MVTGDQKKKDKNNQRIKFCARELVVLFLQEKKQILKNYVSACEQFMFTVGFSIVWRLGPHRVFRLSDQ